MHSSALLTPFNTRMHHVGHTHSLNIRTLQVLMGTASSHPATYAMSSQSISTCGWSAQAPDRTILQGLCWNPDIKFGNTLQVTTTQQSSLGPSRYSRAPEELQYDFQKVPTQQSIARVSNSAEYSQSIPETKGFQCEVSHLESNHHL